MNLDQLADLASAATQEREVCWFGCSDISSQAAIGFWLANPGYINPTDADMEFIGAANPQSVLALVAVVRAANDLSVIHETNKREGTDISRELAWVALKSALAALESS